jgi:hypothetical protein
MEQLERERIEREKEEELENKRKERERRRKEREEREEEERLERERIEKKRLEELEIKKQEKERKKKEREERLEQERLERLEREEQERLERERKEKERQERKERKERERFEKEKLEQEERDRKSDITEESTVGKYGYKKNRYNDISGYLGGSMDNKDALKKWEEEVRSNAKKNKRVHHQSLELHVEEDYDNMKEIENQLRNSLMSLGEGKKNKGKSTKIKIYKCVLWKNIYPYVNEDTIKSFIRRSGSQLFEKGGFVFKLPSKHNSIDNNISVNNFDGDDEKEN